MHRHLPPIVQAAQVLFLASFLKGLTKATDTPPPPPRHDTMATRFARFPPCAGELLDNGICLPADWPPKNVSYNHTPQVRTGPFPHPTSRMKA